MTACTIVFFAGIRRFPRVVRRVVYVATAAAIAFAAVSTVAFGLGAMRARNDLLRGGARRRGGGRRVRVRRLRGGRGASSSCRRRPRAGSRRALVAVAAGAGFVPVVAQHYDAAVGMSAAGADRRRRRRRRARRHRPGLAARRRAHRPRRCGRPRGPLGRVEAPSRSFMRPSMIRSPWLIGRAEYEIADFHESIAAHLPSWRTPSMPSSWRRDCSAPTVRAPTRPVHHAVRGTPARRIRRQLRRAVDRGRTAGAERLRPGRGVRRRGAGGGRPRRRSGGLPRPLRPLRLRHDGRLVGDATFGDLAMTPDFPWVGEAPRDAYARPPGEPSTESSPSTRTCSPRCSAIPGRSS